MALARKHGVGNKANTGLVIVLAVGDRSYQFLTGEGLEGTLPDGQIQLIEDRYFVPLLKKQEWDDAMLVAVKAIDLVIQGDTELTALEDSGNVVGGVFLLIVLFGVILVYCLYLLNIANPRCPQCHQRKVQKLRQQEQRLNRDGRVVRLIVSTYRCQHCGQVFTRERTEDDDQDDSRKSPEWKARWFWWFQRRWLIRRGIFWWRLFWWRWLWWTFLVCDSSFNVILATPDTSDTKLLFQS